MAPFSRFSRAPSSSGSPHMFFEGAALLWFPSLFFEGAVFKGLVLDSEEYEQGLTSSPPGGPLRARRAAIEYVFHGARRISRAREDIEREVSVFATSSCSSLQGNKRKRVSSFQKMFYICSAWLITRRSCNRLRHLHSVFMRSYCGVCGTRLILTNIRQSL